LRRIVISSSGSDKPFAVETQCQVWIQKVLYCSLCGWAND
jgi:hypothetical protein